MGDLSPNELQNLLAQAVQAGEVAAVQAVTGPKGGRPTDRYRLALDEVVS